TSSDIPKRVYCTHPRRKTRPSARSRLPPVSVTERQCWLWYRSGAPETTAPTAGTSWTSQTIVRMPKIRRSGAGTSRGSDCDMNPVVTNPLLGARVGHQPNVVRFRGGARRGPRVPRRIYSAWAEALGPDRSKRGLGRSHHTRLRRKLPVRSGAHQ